MNEIRSFYVKTCHRAATGAHQKRQDENILYQIPHGISFSYLSTEKGKSSSDSQEWQSLVHMLNSAWQHGEESGSSTKLQCQGVMVGSDYKPFP